MRSYLNGMDHAAAGLGAVCRHTPGQSNHFILTLEFSGSVEQAWVRERLDGLPEMVLRMLSGRARRAWHLAPWWCPGNPEPVPLDWVDEPCGGGAWTKFADLPLPEHCALAVRGVTLPENRSMLLFKFSHRLFDGVGAEYLLKMILTGATPVSRAHPGMSTPELNDWRRQFQAGKRLNRALRSINAAGTIHSCETAGTGRTGGRMLLKSIPLAPVAAAGEREAGPFMLGCYAMAMSARAAVRWMETHGLGDGVQLVMPVSLDLRKRATAHETIFFNQWGILPLAWNVSVEHDRAWWIRETQKQTAAALEAGLPADFQRANLPMRILPERAIGWIGQHCFRHGAGSLMFSFLAQSDLPERFHGVEIADFYHAPLMPPAPVCGLFLNCWRDRLNLVASWREGGLKEAEAEALLALAAAELTGA